MANSRFPTVKTEAKECCSFWIYSCLRLFLVDIHVEGIERSCFNPVLVFAFVCLTYFCRKNLIWFLWGRMLSKECFQILKCNIKLKWFISDLICYSLNVYILRLMWISSISNMLHTFIESMNDTKMTLFALQGQKISAL